MTSRKNLAAVASIKEEMETFSRLTNKKTRKSKSIVKSKRKEVTRKRNESFFDIENEDLLVSAMKAYLIDELSYKDIETKVYGADFKSHRVGYKIMKKLNGLGINVEKKGSLKNNTIESLIENASGKFLDTLVKYKDKLKDK